VFLARNFVAHALPLSGTPALRGGHERGVLPQQHERRKPLEPELLDMEFDSLAKDKRVIVLARNAETSAAAASLLHHHGFDVCSVEGGVGAWHAAGHPLVKADGRTT